MSVSYRKFPAWGSWMNSFAAKHAELEDIFRRLAKEDDTLYLPNPAPDEPVDFVLIAMEPSIGGWARSVEDASLLGVPGIQELPAVH